MGGVINDRFKPISSAPKDGTVIVVAHEDTGAFRMRWNPEAENDVFAPGQVGMWEAPDGSMTWSDRNGHGPSHWREAD